MTNNYLMIVNGTNIVDAALLIIHKMRQLQKRRLAGAGYVFINGRGELFFFDHSSSTLPYYLAENASSMVGYYTSTIQQEELVSDIVFSLASGRESISGGDS